MKTPHLTPHEIQQRIWRELGRATQDRHHAWRTPVLATTGADATPEARTIVLREADSSLSSLRFYTDSRSPKVSELISQPRASLVFWSKRLNWQLRARVDMCVQSAGPQIDAVWERVSQSAAAGDYLSTDGPGDPLPVERAAPSNTKSPHHLAILAAQVQQIDWLELRRGGHRRAWLSVNTWQWRVP